MNSRSMRTGKPFPIVGMQTPGAGRNVEVYRISLFSDDEGGESMLSNSALEEDMDEIKVHRVVLDDETEGDRAAKPSSLQKLWNQPPSKTQSSPSPRKPQVVSRRAYAASLLMMHSPNTSIISENDGSLSNATGRFSVGSSAGTATGQSARMPTKPRERLSTGDTASKQVGTRTSLRTRQQPGARIVEQSKRIGKTLSSLPQSSILLSNDELASNTNVQRNVKVVVRCCPSQTEPALLVRSSNELTVNVACKLMDTVSDKNSNADALSLIIASEKDNVFKFDQVLGSESLQEAAYESVADVVHRVLRDNVPGTILAYGQTATGKTHTMGLLPLSLHETVGLGCIPRAILHLFREVDNIEVSALELYLDVVSDLLLDGPAVSKEKPLVKNEWDDPPSPDASKSVLPIREKDGRFFVQGLTKVTCSSSEESWNVVKRAIMRRMTRETEMNLVSSRSHTIITFTVKGQELSFVDLAGSERLNRSQSDFKETAFINSSLATLGNVVRALAVKGASQVASTFVPFRDSKLTRLLQPSLCQGNAALFATVSMDPDNILETISTLKFAERCIALSKVVGKRDLSASFLNQAMQEEEAAFREQALRNRLRIAMATLHRLALYNPEESGDSWEEMDDLSFEQKREELEEKITQRFHCESTPKTVASSNPSHLEVDMRSIHSPSERQWPWSSPDENVEDDYDLL